MERRTAGPLPALVTLLVIVAGVFGAVSAVTLGGGTARTVMPTPKRACVAPAAGTLIKRADSTEVSVFTGGARVAYRSWTELTAGYGSAPVIVTVPDAFYDALPTQVASGTLIRTAGNPAIAEVRNGRRSVFPGWEALIAARGPAPRFVVVPAYYFDQLPASGS